jgi:hypothetical protein
MEINPERMRRRNPAIPFRLGIAGIARIDEERKKARTRDELVQQFQPLRRDLDARVGHARDVAARPVEGSDESKRDRIEPDLEHDGNGPGRRLCRKRCRSGGRGDQAYLTLNQIDRQSWQSLVVILGEAVFDCDVLTFGLDEPRL